MNSTQELDAVNESECSEFDFLLADGIDIYGSQSGNCETCTNGTERAFRFGYCQSVDQSLKVLQDADDPNECLADLEQTAREQRVYGDSDEAAITRGFEHGLISGIELLRSEDDFEQQLSAFARWVDHVHAWAASDCDRVVIVAFFFESEFANEQEAEQLMMLSAELDDEPEEEEIPTLDFPEECLYPPGPIGDLVRWNLQTSLYPQPEHALAGSLAMWSLVTGRRVADSFGTRTNLLITALGPTRSGKERVRDINKQILFTVNHPEMFEEKIASNAALNGFMKQASAGLLMLDELGDWLALARSKNGANSQPAQILSNITKYYSSSGCHFKADRYADTGKQVEINQPHLVFYGTSTGEIFWKHVTPDYLAGGLFGRMMIFENRGYVLPQPSADSQATVPSSIIDEIKVWLQCYDHAEQNLLWLNPKPFIAPHTPEAFSRFSDHQLAIAKKRVKESALRAAMWSGTAEHTAKLALLFATSRSHNPLQIQIDDVDRAIMLSNWLTRRKIILSGDYVAENAVEDALKRVLRIVKQSGRKGIGRAALTRKTQWMKPNDRMGCINDLVSSRQIVMQTIATKTNKKDVYVDRKYLKP